MDELQIKHAFDQIEMHQEELKTHLLNGSNARVEDLEDQISRLQDDLEEAEDNARDTESENDDLKDQIKKIRAILEDLVSEDAGFDYVKERVEEALELI
jgi:archaellum component FlaC